MNPFTLTLTEAEEAGLEHVVAKVNTANQTAVQPSDYLAARVRDVLASYTAEIMRDREKANRAMIEATLSLPDADRDEVVALIRSKLAR